MIRWMLIVAASVLFASAVLGEEGFEPSETQTLLASLNDTYRVSRGLDAHQLDPDLCRLCQKHAEWMASRGSMFHGSGENIVAWGPATAPGALAIWRASGPHNGFLLSSTTRSGWGHAVSAGGQHYWAGAFRSQVAALISPETRLRRPGLLGWLRRR